MIHFLKTQIGVATLTLLLVSTAQADTESIGPNGINSAGLGLTGAGIVIGKIEQGRPGDTNNGDDAAHSNTTTNPTGVFEKGNIGNPTPAVTPNAAEVSSHAQKVAA